MFIPAALALEIQHQLNPSGTMRIMMVMMMIIIIITIKAFADSHEATVVANGSDGRWETLEVSSCI